MLCLCCVFEFLQRKAILDDIFNILLRVAGGRYLSIETIIQQ